MSRHGLREQLFKLVFRVEYHPAEDMPEQEDLFIGSTSEDKSITETDREEIREKFDDIIKNLPEIDKVISDSAKDWSIERIGKVELAVLRVAVYEMLYDISVPVGVAINEAVDLAKSYGEDGSGSFVNGVLAGVFKGDNNIKDGE